MCGGVVEISKNPQVDRGQMLTAMPLVWNVAAIVDSLPSLATLANTNQWIHVAATLNYLTFNVSFYINGQSVFNGSGTSRPPCCGTLPQTQLVIGRAGAGNPFRGFWGYMRQFVVYPFVLTPSQVLRLSQISDMWCPPGTFADLRGIPTCANCSIGRYASASGQTTCLPCVLGAYCSSAGMSTPVSCPQGSFCGTTGLTASGFPCPYGMRFVVGPFFLKQCF
jgi:hypothetical protein